MRSVSIADDVCDFKITFVAGIVWWRLDEAGFLPDRWQVPDMSWDDLFDRADDRAVTIEEIRTTLEAQRDDG